MSNLVVVPKNEGNGELDEIRLSTDSRHMKKAIKRTRFPTKTIEDIIYLVNGEKYFLSKYGNK